MPQTVTSLKPGEYTIGSAANGGLTTNLGNIYYVPQTPANPGTASKNNVPFNPQNDTPSPPPPSNTGGDPNANKSGYYQNELGKWVLENQPLSGKQNVDWYYNEFGKQVPIEAPKGPSDQELNSAYDPIFSYLNQAEEGLRKDFPTYTQDINNQFDTSKSQLGNYLQSGKQTIDSQLQDAGKQKQDVISSARSLFNELQMANQQRFGSASSAGQFASELQGRELQRGTGKADQQFTQLTRDLGIKKLELDQNYQLSLKRLEDQKSAQINEINRNFQEKLLQINSQRAMSEAEKAGRRLQYLQDYKNQTYAVQLSNYQMAQQLASMKAQSDMELQNYEKQLQISNKYAGGQTSSFANSLNGGISIPGATQQSSQPINTLNFGGNVQDAVGALSANKDNQMIGQISNPLDIVKNTLGY